MNLPLNFETDNETPIYRNLHQCFPRLYMIIIAYSHTRPHPSSHLNVSFYLKLYVVSISISHTNHQAALYFSLSYAPLAYSYQCPSQKSHLHHHHKELNWFPSLCLNDLFKNFLMCLNSTLIMSKVDCGLLQSKEGCS